MLLLPTAVGLLATPLGKLLAALLVTAVVIFLGRIVLNVAWKLVLAATAVVGVLYVFSILL